MSLHPLLFDPSIEVGRKFKVDFLDISVIRPYAGGSVVSQRPSSPNRRTTIVFASFTQEVFTMMWNTRYPVGKETQLLVSCTDQRACERCGDGHAIKRNQGAIPS